MQAVGVIATAVEETSEAVVVTDELQAAIDLANAAPETDGSMWIHGREGGCGDCTDERDIETTKLKW
jgi:hypothetical protein